MNMSLIIMEEEYSAIDTDYYSCRGYYMIKVSSQTYTFQEDLSIGGQIISSGKILCEGTYFFPINMNSHYYVLQKNKSINTVFSLGKIINGNVNIICYGWNDFFPQCLRSISQSSYNTLSPLHIPMKKHNIIMDENNRREVI